jgi:DnaK suppressor protein
LSVSATLTRCACQARLKTEEISVQNLKMDELVTKLASSRADIHGALVLLDEGRKPVALDQTTQGRVSRIDAITQQQMAKAGRTHLQLQLERIRAALERHEAGRYGLCCRCELDIGLERLTADPATPFCLECVEELAENREREQRMAGVRR